MPNHSALEKRNPPERCQAALPLFALALVLVRFDHIASVGVAAWGRGSGLGIYVRICFSCFAFGRRRWLAR